eukprot:gene5637-11374_t
MSSSPINLELVGSILIIYAYMRTGKRFSLSHYVFCGFKLILPPTAEDLERIKDPPKHKRSKTAPKQRNVYEKLEFLELQMCTLNTKLVMGKGSLITQQIFWEGFDILMSAGLCCVLIHFWSECYRLIRPRAIESDWVSIMACGVIIIAVTSQLLALRADRALQQYSSIGFGIGGIVAALTFTLFTIPQTHLVSIREHRLDVPLVLFVRHIHSLLRVLSPLPWPVAWMDDQGVLWGMYLSKGLLSLGIGALATGIFPVALRFSHSLLVLTGGSKAERTSPPARLRLWAEVFIPLVIGVAMFLINPSISTSPLDQSRQLLAILLLAFLRASNFQVLLQCYLDRGGSEVALALSFPEVDGVALQMALGDRIRGIVIAAAELLSPVVLLLASTILAHRNSNSLISLRSAIQQALGLPTVESIPYTVPDSMTLSTLLSQQLSFDRASLGAIRSFLHGVRLHSVIPRSSAFAFAWSVVALYCIMWSLSVLCAITYWFLFPVKFRLSRL